jgi:hypothetical protein
MISFSAKGLTAGEISAYLAEICGADVSMQTISTITDRVIVEMSLWQSRPLDQAQVPSPVTMPQGNGQTHRSWRRWNAAWRMAGPLLGRILRTPLAQTQ